MQEQESINISFESDIKTIAEAIFEQFGLTKNEAIKLFYRQVAMTKDIPFIQRSLNEETIKAIEEVKEKDNLKTYHNFAEICQDIEA